MPVLSVIVPVYGVEKYIERCARSLFEQSLDGIEYIFVDDCSPDRSVEILQTLVKEYAPAFEKRHETVIVERMPSHSGQAAARVRGMQLATGDYIIHCDSDDWVGKDAYRLMHEKALAEGADVVVCDHIMHDGKDALRYVKAVDRGTEPDTMLVDAARDKSTWALWDKMMRRECLKNVIVFPKDNLGEDMAVTFQVLASQPKVAYLERGIYYYYVNPESITKGVTKEMALEMYHQLLSNVDVVKLSLQRSGKYEKYAELMDCLYYRTLNVLVRFIPDREIYRLWRQSVRDLHIKVLGNPYIKSHYKIRHVILMAHLNFLFIRKGCR